MKLTLPFLTALFLFACETPAPETEAPQAEAPEQLAVPIEDFGWLVGEWKRSNDKGEKQTYETWTQTSETEYAGHGYTLLKSDTTFQEHMLLVRRDGTWQLEVAGAGNENPVAFKLTEIGEKSFVSENPEHDAPTKIRYARNVDIINAAIYAGENWIPFDFEKR
ncbi:MAG: DUF6265 family protein [Calditrichota bacterium]